MAKELDQLKHARSAKDFPGLDLEPDEYVILSIARAKAGIVLIWLVVFLCVIFSLGVLFALLGQSFFANSYLAPDAQGFLVLIILCLIALFIFSGLVGQNIYQSNRMFITNRRIIQDIRLSLFNRSTNIISLANIEDVSFHQRNLFEHLLRVGVLRLSTVGDETTYTFNFLNEPTDEIKTITHLVYLRKHDNN